MNLLLRDYRTPIKTPVKRLQDSYKSLIKRLQDSCQDSYQEITALLPRDYRTLIKRLQDSYQEITALLSRDYKTPMNLL